MKEFEIWTASTFSEEYRPPSAFKPIMIGKESAINFQVACFKHYIKRMLNSVEEQEKTGYVQEQSMNWFYSQHTNSASWEGKYYQTKEEAQMYLDSLTH